MLDFEFPEVTAVRPDGAYRLWLRFSDGVEGCADVADLLHGPVFETLREPAAFSRVHVDAGTVAWESGADVAPEALYERLIPDAGSALKQSYRQLFDDAERRMRADVAGMPEVSRFFGIVIRMFWREDEAPHFHAQYGEFVASVDIATGSFTTRGFPGRALQLVEEWRERHRDELLENWERMRRHEQPIAIEPLA